MPRDQTRQFIKLGPRSANRFSRIDLSITSNRPTFPSRDTRERARACPEEIDSGSGGGRRSKNL